MATVHNNIFNTAFGNPTRRPAFPNLTNLSAQGTSAQRCLFYFVALDQNNCPIPGTMSAKNNNTLLGCTQHMARLTGQVMTPPSGYIQCFPASGLRYWYQVQSIPTGGGNARTVILPNSMIEVHGVPKNAAGAGRSCQYVEYKIFKQIGS